MTCLRRSEPPLHVNRFEVAEVMNLKFRDTGNRAAETCVNAAHSRQTLASNLGLW
jgi:hypothetical protein